MNNKTFLLSEGLTLLQRGLSVIAVDKNKRAILPWKAYSENLISPEALTRQINSAGAEGIAVICGAVSGNLEVIDFDLKNDLTGDLMERYFDRLPASLIAKLPIVRTRSGGFHIYYRCECIEGNQKLASRPASPGELIDTPHLKQLCIIETRGNNGYVVAPPTDGYIYRENKFIPILSLDERDTLLDAARFFMEVHTEERAKFVETGTPFILSPFEDYNQKADPVSLLLRHGWTLDTKTKNAEKVFLVRPGVTSAPNSGNVLLSTKLFYCWSTSTEFKAEKAYSPAAVYATLEHGGDYSAASKQLIKEGYGAKRTADNIKEALKTPFAYPGKFWTVDEKLKIKINLTQLVEWIHKEGGFTGFKYNKETESILVQEEKGFLREVEIYDIKQFLKTNILAFNEGNNFDGITPEALLEVVYREYLQYLSKNFMDFLSVTEFDFLKDTAKESFFPFANGVVKITAEDVTLNTYGKMKKVVWASQKIDRHITLDNLKVDGEIELAGIPYAEFIRLAAGEGEGNGKFEYFVSILGYLLHKYKDPKNAFAVILAEESEDENDGGGTGKGLFVKGIKELIPTEIFDGKQFSPGKAFAFQRVSLDTKVIAIEDAKRGFRFEEMNSLITEGIPVEKKNQKEFFIPFADCPKITISTNYVISDEGNHAKRRQKVLEFSNFFSPTHTPFDEFGQMLFEDWDKDDWNKFYNFMFLCVQVYLRKGILPSGQSETNKLKNVKLKYTEDLLFYFQALVEGFGNEFLPFRELYSDFLMSYELTSKEFSKERFSKGLKYCCSTLGYNHEDRNGKIDGKTQLMVKIVKKPVNP